MLEKHGCPVKKELKSELYNSSTLCQVVFQVLHYANLIGLIGGTKSCNAHMYTLTPLGRPSLSTPPAFVRDCLASQTSTAHTLLYWHYRITRMDVLIGHVCGGRTNN